MAPKNNILTSARFIEAPVPRVPRYRSNQSSLHEFDSFPISRHGRPLPETGSFSESGSTLSETVSDLSDSQASSLSSFESLENSDNILRFFSVYHRNTDVWELVSEWVPRDFSGQDSQCELWKLSALTREAREITWHLAELDEIYREKGVLPKDVVDQNCQTLVSIPPEDVENEGQEIATEIEIVEVPTIETVVEKQSVQTQTEESVNWSFFEFLKAKITNCLESLNDCLQSLNESFDVLFGDDVKTIYFVCDFFFDKSLDLLEKIYFWFF